MLKERLQEAVGKIQRQWGGNLTTGKVVVLGSGLGDNAQSIFDDFQAGIPYSKIPGMPEIEAVPGHECQLLLGEMNPPEVANYPLAIMQGRLHRYQDYTPNEVLFLLRTLIFAGAKTVILCSAAGVANEEFKPGDIITIKDHINRTSLNPLISRNEIAELGPQFPDQTEVYHRELLGFSLMQCPTSTSAIYGFMPGPSFETPAEVRAWQRDGADVIGMSMPLEATAANQMGAKVAGFVLATNMAAGLGGKLSHQEVLDITEKKRPEFHEMLRAMLLHLPTE